MLASLPLFWLLVVLIDAELPVDGNGWSQRYGRLLSTGSVVFKSTVFPEWNTPWLIPYYHFVVCGFVACWPNVNADPPPNSQSKSTTPTYTIRWPSFQDTQMASQGTTTSRRRSART